MNNNILRISQISLLVVALIFGFASVAFAEMSVRGSTASFGGQRTISLSNVLGILRVNTPEQSNAEEAVTEASQNNNTGGNSSTDQSNGADGANGNAGGADNSNGGNGGATSGNGGNGGDGGSASPGGLVRAGEVVSNSTALNMLNVNFIRITTR